MYSNPYSDPFIRQIIQQLNELMFEALKGNFDSNFIIQRINVYFRHLDNFSQQPRYQRNEDLKAAREQLYEALQLARASHPKDEFMFEAHFSLASNALQRFNESLTGDSPNYGAVREETFYISNSRISDFIHRQYMRLSVVTSQITAGGKIFVIVIHPDEFYEIDDQTLTKLRNELLNELPGADSVEVRKDYGRIDLLVKAKEEILFRFDD